MTSPSALPTTPTWLSICQLGDILPNMGRCALLVSKSGREQQIAIFRIVSLSGEESLYALDNYCPFSLANIISRGITGNIADTIVVASPLYKQHFDLNTGQCLEDKNVQLKTYPIRLNGNSIELAA